MAVLFATCVCILAIGFVWFYVVRPILEDYGVIVNPSQEPTAHVMSRSDTAPTPSMALSLQTDGVQTDRQPATVKPGRVELLTLYSTMRAAGITREQARPALKAVGLPLDNNLWAEAAPPEAPHVTPYAGRPTNARFETDADYPYQAPA
jgi:hypothetical protein